MSKVSLQYIRREVHKLDLRILKTSAKSLQTLIQNSDLEPRTIIEKAAKLAKHAKRKMIRAADIKILQHL